MTGTRDKTGNELPPKSHSDDSPVASTGPQIEQESPQYGKSMSFMGKVRRERRPLIASIPFAIAGDMQAGVRLFESRQDRLIMIKFEEKPAIEVLTRVKEYGFRWNPRDLIWVHPVRPDNQHSIRVEAGRLYQDVRAMLPEAKGLENHQEMSF